MGIYTGCIWTCETVYPAWIGEGLLEIYVLIYIYFFKWRKIIFKNVVSLISFYVFMGYAEKSSDAFNLYSYYACMPKWGYISVNCEYSKMTALFRVNILIYNVSKTVWFLIIQNLQHKNYVNLRILNNVTFYSWHVKF